MEMFQYMELFWFTDSYFKNRFSDKNLEKDIFRFCGFSSSDFHEVN